MKLFARGFSHLPPLPKTKTRRILAAGVVSLAAFCTLHAGGAPPQPCDSAMLRAAQRMDEAVRTVARHRDSTGGILDVSLDPNRTGLIGPEDGELTTSVGHLEAKRTTANPDMAALIVHLLCRAGAKAGDTIAVGSSGSFPALLVATLAAAETLEVKPAVIISLGASSFGATRSGFNLLHLHTLLLEQGVFRTPPLAVSLGGEEDSGLSFDPDVRSTLTEQVSRSGIPLLQERDLRKNVLDRMRRYDGMARGGRIAAYINIGGSHTNLGTSALVLQLRPGLNRHPALPPEANRGVVSEMAARGIPVIHLLYVRGLAERYGLPWDPIPLPEAGAWRPSEGPEEGLRFWVIFAAYFMALGILTGRIDRRGRGSRSGTAALS